ncbi:MAG TPA: hypothetical protein VGF84_01405 [Micromonosporaceae bacterium]
MLRDEANAPRYDGGARGHYESWFVRGNDPASERAIWLRYTIFAPAGRPADAVAELWAVVFDGDHVAVKTVTPIGDATFASGSGLAIRIGEALLTDRAVSGSAASGNHRISWQLSYAGGGEPVILLPERLYTGGFPKAKALVPAPGVTLSGEVSVDGVPMVVDGWIGSQNHNWGSRHTDEYAWGQVVGFDNDPDAFLECSTARIRMVGMLSPPFTPVVLRVHGEELRLNSMATMLRASARYRSADDPLTWTWRTSGRDGAGRPVRVVGEFSAPRAAFVTLAYDNPPGGTKTCENTKIARCRVIVTGSGAPMELISEHRAALEILG